MNDGEINSGSLSSYVPVELVLRIVTMIWLVVPSGVFGNSTGDGVTVIAKGKSVILVVILTSGAVPAALTCSESSGKTEMMLIATMSVLRRRLLFMRGLRLFILLSNLQNPWIYPFRQFSWFLAGLSS